MATFVNNLFPLTSTGSAMGVQIEGRPNVVSVLNETQSKSTSGSTSVHVSALWKVGMGDGTAILTQTLGGATNPSTLLGTYLATNGISYMDTSIATTGTSISFATLTSTNPVTLTSVSPTTIPSSGFILIQSATNAAQVVGMIYYYTLSGSVMTLPYLDGSGFAAAGTTGTAITQPMYAYNTTKYPAMYVTGITTGTTTQVRLSAPSNFAVNQYVSLQIPVAFSSQLSAFFSQISRKNLGFNAPSFMITAVDSTTTLLTINADTSGITNGFSFPSSAVVVASPLGAFPQIMYAGQYPTKNDYDLAQAPAQPQLLVLGSGVVGNSGDSLLVEVSYGSIINQPILWPIY